MQTAEGTSCNYLYNSRTLHTFLYRRQPFLQLHNEFSKATRGTVARSWWHHSREVWYTANGIREKSLSLFLYMVYDEGASMRRASTGEVQEHRLWNLFFARATPLSSPEDADGNTPNKSSWDPFSLDSSISQPTSTLARSPFPLGFAVHRVSWGLIHCSYLLMKPKQLS